MIFAKKKSQAQKLDSIIIFSVNYHIKYNGRGQKSKSRTTTEQGKLQTKGKSIRKRDKSVYKHKEFEHWELDTVVSGKGKRELVSLRWQRDVIIQGLSQLPRGAIKTITTDNGKEFVRWENIEKALGWTD